MSVKRYDSNGFESEYGIWVRAVDYDALVEQHSKSGTDFVMVPKEVMEFFEFANTVFAAMTPQQEEMMISLRKARVALGMPEYRFGEGHKPVPSAAHVCMDASYNGVDGHAPCPACEAEHQGPEDDPFGEADLRRKSYKSPPSERTE